MDLDLVFAKTSAGEEAVHQRTRLVQRNLRTVLIVVDGRSSVRDLCEKVGSQQVVETALEQLARDGYIHAVSGEPAPELGAPVAEELVEAVEERFPVFKEPEVQEAPVSVPPPAPPPPPSPFLIPEDDRIAHAREAAPEAAAGNPLTRLLGRLGRRGAAPESAEIKPIRRGGTRHGLGRWLGIAVAALVVSLVVGVFAFPYERYRGDVESALSAALGQPVKVGALRGALLPTPALVLEQLRIGANGEVGVREIRALPAIGSLFGAPRTYREVFVDGVTLPGERLGAVVQNLPRLLKTESYSVRHLALERVAISLRDLALEDFAGEIIGETDDKPLRVALRNAPGTVNLELRLEAGGVSLGIDGTRWKASADSPYVFENLSVQGKLTDAALLAGKLEGRIFDGSLNGQIAVDWVGGVRLRADLELAHGSGKRLSEALGAGFALDGEVSGHLRGVAAAERFAPLFDKATFTGDFVARRGSLQGVDLVEAVRRGGRGTRGGTTHFDQFSGRMAWDGKAVRLSALELVSGALRASGHLTVSQGKRAAGNLDVQLRGGATDIRLPVAVSGTTNDLQLGDGGR